MLGVCMYVTCWEKGNRKVSYVQLPLFLPFDCLFFLFNEHRVPTKRAEQTKSENHINLGVTDQMVLTLNYCFWYDFGPPFKLISWFMAGTRKYTRTIRRVHRKWVRSCTAVALRCIAVQCSTRWSWWCTRCSNAPSRESSSPRTKRVGGRTYVAGQFLGNNLFFTVVAAVDAVFFRRKNNTKNACAAPMCPAQVRLSIVIILFFIFLY